MQLSASVLYIAAVVLPVVSSYAIQLRTNSDVIIIVSFIQKSILKVTNTNNAANDISVLKAGIFLDPAPVYTATVFKDWDSTLSSRYWSR